MNNETVDKKGIAWFLVLAFFTPVVLLIILSNIKEIPTDKKTIYYNLFMLTVMFFPGTAAFLVRKFINKEESKNSMVRFGSLKPYLQVSLFIPLLYTIIYAITGLFYPPDFTLNTFMAQWGIKEIPVEPALFIFVFFIFTILIVPIINFIPAFGEEFGWRGYLLPKLLPLGKDKALIISGIIWGLWHLPFILLINYGSYPNEIAGCIIFTVLLTLLGIYIGALTLENNSTLLASYMHAVINAQDHGIWILIYPNYNHLIGGGEGIIGIIVLLPVALYYLKKVKFIPP